jgi:hypothetical protein
MAQEGRDLGKRLSQLKLAVLARDAKRHVSALKSISDLPLALQTPHPIDLGCQQSHPDHQCLSTQIQHD